MLLVPLKLKLLQQLGPSFFVVCFFGLLFVIDQIFENWLASLVKMTKKKNLVKGLILWAKISFIIMKMTKINSKMTEKLGRNSDVWPKFVSEKINPCEDSCYEFNLQVLHYKQVTAVLWVLALRFSSKKPLFDCIYYI